MANLGLYQRLRKSIHAFKLRGPKKELEELLQNTKSLNTFDHSLNFMIQLIKWIRSGSDHAESINERIQILNEVLLRNPEWKNNASLILNKGLLEISYVRLFSDVGLPNSNDLIKETQVRIAKKILSYDGDPNSMSALFLKVFNNIKDTKWLENIDDTNRARIENWIFNKDLSELLAHKLMQELYEASTVLCTQSASIALREDIMTRADHLRVNHNPFVILQRFVDSFFEFITSESQFEELLNKFKSELEEKIILSHNYLTSVRLHLEKFGVSVDIVFQLERASSYLERLSLLIELSYQIKRNQILKNAESSQNLSQKSWKIVALLSEAAVTDKKVSALLRENLRLISRKIIEKTGATGEDYITRTKSEYYKMFLGAAGGGALTAFTALIKLYSPKGLPPFIEALFHTMNYSLSFIIMHHLHFKLATKQPSMTAANLAEKLNETDIKHSPTEFVDLVARISRSQFAAVLGNILIVIPVALLMTFIIRSSFGQEILSQEKSMYVIHSLDPRNTLTIFYAILTGILLWLSGLFSGWVQNAFIYYRVQSLLKHQKLFLIFLGTKNTSKFVDWIGKNLNAWASSISLGLFLAFTPQIGNFFGLPLDVRHITLSTGSLAYAYGSLGFEAISKEQMLHSIAGISIIGFMNFFISFSLALFIAIRAKNLSSTRVRRMFFNGFKLALKRPLSFFFPKN